MFDVDNLSWKLPEADQNWYLEHTDITKEELINQLVLPVGHKDCWFNCARLIERFDDKHLVPNLVNLFEWFKDLNWPGADIIAKRIFQLPKEAVKRAYVMALRKAMDAGDLEWLENMKCVFEEEKGPYFINTNGWTSLKDYKN